MRLRCGPFGLLQATFPSKGLLEAPAVNRRDDLPIYRFADDRGLVRSAQRNANRTM